MRRFAFAAVVAVVAFGYAVAEEITVTISKVKDDEITYFKTSVNKGKKGKKGDVVKSDPVTVKVTTDAKIAKGDFDADTMKYKVGEEVKDGLKNELFTKASDDNGVLVRITVEDDEKSPNKGKVTQILTGVKAGGGKKGKAGGG